MSAVEGVHHGFGEQAGVAVDVVGVELGPVVLVPGSAVGVG
jgi:hypothetical protein